MSGGYFDYQQFNLESMAEKIETLLKMNDNLPQYPADIVEKFKETSHALRRCQEMVTRVDYLLSRDDGEDSFRERWKEEVLPPWKP